MNTKLVLSAAAAAIAMLAQGAYAQTSPTRAEVKAEAKEGAIAPAGQGPGAMAGSAARSGMSTRSRADRKATTRMAEKAGELKPAGEAAEKITSDETRAKATTTNRADRKAKTKAAVKAGETKPAGEAPLPVAVEPKK